MADHAAVRPQSGAGKITPAHISAGDAGGDTALLLLSDGSVFAGLACGASGEASGELCCNTVMAGFQEVLSDPDYAGRLLVFTFPHVGAVGANAEDMESAKLQARGVIMAEQPSLPANFRAEQGFDEWLAANGCVGIAGVDTRAIMRRVRDHGPLTAIIATVDKNTDIEALRRRAASADGTQPLAAGSKGNWDEGSWQLGEGYAHAEPASDAPHVVVIDHGARHSLLRQLVAGGARVTRLPADSDMAAVEALGADALFLSNGPGDPAEAHTSLPLIRSWLQTGKPLFGIGLGMQLLALALGGRTALLQQGRYGVNHPVRRLADGHVEAVAMNHRWYVERDSLPGELAETHISLFDGTIAGLALRGKPVFGVQFHPETPPWHQGCHILFRQFLDSVAKAA